MLKIWGRASSANVQKVMWLIGELGIAHERIDAGLQFGQNNEDWFEAMNPNRTVPVLDDDGFILWESNAILRYLARRQDAETLYPSGLRERADIERWMDWQLGVLSPWITAILKNLIRTPPEKRDQAVIDNAIAQATKGMRLLDKHLAGRDFVVADALTLADIALGPMAQRWHAFPIERPELPALAAWYGRLTERPAYREHVMLPLS